MRKPQPTAKIIKKLKCFSKAKRHNTWKNLRITQKPADIQYGKALSLLLLLHQFSQLYA